MIQSHDTVTVINSTGVSISDMTFGKAYNMTMAVLSSDFCADMTQVEGHHSRCVGHASDGSVRGECGATNTAGHSQRPQASLADTI